MTRPKPVDLAEQRQTVEPFRNLRLHAWHWEALDDLEATRLELEIALRNTDERVRPLIREVLREENPTLMDEIEKLERERDAVIAKLRWAAERLTFWAGAGAESCEDLEQLEDEACELRAWLTERGL